jgi:hypothetical protein
MLILTQGQEIMCCHATNQLEFDRSFAEPFTLNARILSVVIANA